MTETSTISILGSRLSRDLICSRSMGKVCLQDRPTQVILLVITLYPVVQFLSCWTSTTYANEGSCWYPQERHWSCYWGSPFNQPNIINWVDLICCLVQQTYNLMSERWFTHASPTLFNSGTCRPQLSSCFLLCMKDDSIEGIYDTLKMCANISKSAGGIGLSVHCIRASGSYIAGVSWVYLLCCCVCVWMCVFCADKWSI